jgi:hypothetical protein
MAKYERDTEAHRKAAEKLTFERELCSDVINKHLIKVPENRRPNMRLTLDEMIISPGAFGDQTSSLSGSEIAGHCFD